MNKDIPATIPAAIERAARLWPDDEALVDTLPDGSTDRLTFTQLRERIWQVAAAFVASGVQPGDRVAVWAPNSSTWIAAGYGAYVAGAVLVPLNSRFKGPEAAHVLRTSKARLLFTVTDFLDTDYVELLADQPGLDDLKEIVVLSGANRSDTTSWADFLSRAAGVASTDVDARAAAVRPEDSSDIIFTSGTTGAPKGAVLTHGASTHVYTTWSSGVGLQHGDRYLMVYPFFHTAGLKSCILACILTGAVMVPHPVFDVPSVLARVQEERITMLPGPPAIYQSILNTDRSAYDLSSLRLAVTGAAAIPVSLVVRLRDELGFSSVVTAYGLTETTGTATMCQHDDDPETIATTSGRAIPDTELKVVDDAGRTLPAGEPGEVLVRGYNVMKEYFGDPEATAAAIDADGWLKTGDIAVLDERGNIRITDRKKDMYIVGGFNAYPAEIESIISKHPAVASVAIVGVPDERMGEVGMAYVIPRQGATLDGKEFLAWCREQMANYKVPRYVEVVDALPLHPSGKVLKYELRARAAGRGAQPSSA
jgi:acyl-CoA synthetase (AMP-forming)/AMP-acid ligase II